MSELLLRILSRLLHESEQHDFEQSLRIGAARRPAGRARDRWVRSQLIRSLPPLLVRSMELRGRALRDDARQARRSTAGSLTTVSAVAGTLGIGISAASAVYGVFHAIALAPLPYPEADELYAVQTVQTRAGSDARGVSGPDFLDYREAVPELALGAFDRTSATLTDPGLRPTRVEVSATNADAFALTEATPILGRIFDPNEDVTDAPVAVLAESLWRSRFGGSPDIVGSTVEVEGVRRTVLGVLPSTYALPHSEVSIWVPFGDLPHRLHRRAPVLDVIVRLPTPGDLERAESRLGAVAEALEARYPETNDTRRVLISSLRVRLAGEDHGTLRMLLAGALGLLAVASFNALGLLLARLAERAREFQLRLALGAARGRIISQLWLECMWIVGVAAVFAAGGTAVILALARRIWPLDAFRVESITLDGSILAFGGVLCLVLAVVVPAGVGLGLGEDLRPTRGGRSRLQRALLSGQLAVTVLLFGCSVFALRAWSGVGTIDRGVDSQHLVIGRVDLPSDRYPTGMARYPDWPAVHAFYEGVGRRLAADSRVERHALAGAEPLRGGGFRLGVALATPGVVDTVQSVVRMVSAGWRNAIGLQLLVGRDLAGTDRFDAPAVVLVNDAFVRTYLSGEEPTSASVAYLGATRQVVGVIEDEVPVPGVEAQPSVYAPLSQTPSELVTLVVRPTATHSDGAAAIVDAVVGADAELAPHSVRPLAESMAAELARPRLHAAISTAFGVAGLTLFAAGLAALVRQLLGAARRSIAIRIALGASRATIVRLTIKDVGSVLGAGALAGLLALRLTVPVLGALVPTASDRPWSGILVAAGWIAVVVVATVAPAVRDAWRTDLSAQLRDG